MSAAYRKQISAVARRIGRWFPGHLSELKSSEFLNYLDNIKGTAPRTRNNHLATMRQIVRFAKRMNWLDPNWIELEKIEKELELPGEAQVYQPLEIQKILCSCVPALRPVIVLVAFCGVRTAEAIRLSWTDVDFQFGRVTISAANAKTRSRRICPLPPNASAWLEPGKGLIYRHSERKIQDHLRESLKAADVRQIRNGFRHSFISYRITFSDSAAKTALEAGTSETMIFRNYRDITTPEDAARWFNVYPPGCVANAA